MENDRAFFEPRFDRDLSQVRVHTDTQAAEAVRAVNTRAFTMGQKVVFGPEQFSSGLSTGNRLFAHEKIHMVHQNNGRTGSIVQRWKLKSNKKCLIAGRQSS